VLNQNCICGFCAIIKGSDNDIIVRGGVHVVLVLKIPALASIHIEEPASLLIITEQHAIIYYLLFYR